MMTKKKIAYEKADVSKKIKMLIMPGCLALAVVFFLFNFAMLMGISSSISSIVEEQADSLHRLHKSHVQEEQQANFTNRVNSLITEVQRNISSTTATFVVISLIIAAGMSLAVMLLTMKILHRYICKPLIEFVHNMKNANEGLEVLGIKVRTDTKDEISLIQSVYFNIAQQLKEHADDVVKLTGLTEKFETSAHFDVLTGVYNRRRFMELVEKHKIMAAKRNEPTFVFMLDLDHFKSVNDTYGHDAGDEVLRSIAGRVKETVRSFDLFGRYGGEEFILFISVPDADIAVSSAERIREIIQSAPVNFEGTDIPVTASIGIAQSATDVKFDHTVKLADKALYRAKSNGRNRVEIYGEGM
jgi:diguanylate cyclase (GGDEF)-like protein